MTTIASLRILLGLDSGGVKSGAAGVNAQLKGVQAQANATNATLSQIGKGIGAGLGLGVGLGAFQLASRGVAEFTGFLTDSIKAAADEEAGIVRLTQALKVNAPAWDGDSAAIERVIQGRQALAFADDELRTSLGFLTAATHDIEEGFRLQALAMDLARFRGISLAEASDQLVKVQAGSFRALKSLGIELDKNATSTQALAAIQKVVAGQAEEFAETTVGAMTRAGIAVENLSEDIGEVLAPAFEKAASGIDEILSKDLPSFAENSKREIEDLSKGFRDLAEFIHLTDIADFSRDFAVFIHLAQDGKPAITGITEAVIAQSIAMSDNSRETLMSAKSLAILSGDTERAAAVEHALEAAAAAVTTEMNKQAAANLALEKTAAQNSATAKAWGIRIQDNAGLTQFFTNKINEATRALSFFDQTQAGVFNNMKIPGLDAEGLTGVPKGEGTSLADSFLSDLEQNQRNLDAAAARERERVAERNRLNAEAAANAKRNAAEIASAYRDKVMRAYDDTARAARDMAAETHQATLDQIDDARDLANAQLTEQQRAIRGAVDAERARVAAIRTHRQEEGLRAAVTVATDPEELARAQQQLNDFLDDQRIAFLSSQADVKVAALDAEKAKNDAVAAMAIAAENQRNKDQVAALDKDLRNLKDHLAKYTGAWGKAFAEIAALAKKHHVSDLVGAAAASTAAVSKATSAAAPPVAPVPIPPAAPPPVPVPSIDAQAIRQATEMLNAQMSALTAIGPASVAGTAPPMIPAPSAAVAAGLAPREIVIHTHLHLGPEQIAEMVERYQFNLEGIYAPTPVSTGSQR